eukprot:62908-Prorocentrum_lima.AAC.1
MGTRSVLGTTPCRTCTTGTASTDALQRTSRTKESTRSTRIPGGWHNKQIVITGQETSESSNKECRY